MFESVDQTTLVITVGLMIGVPAVFALVIGIIVLAGRARPQPGLGPRQRRTGGLSPPQSFGRRCRNASRLWVGSPRSSRHCHSLRMDEAKPSSRIELNDSSA